MFSDVLDHLVGLSDDALIERIRTNELERRRLDAEIAAALAVADQRGVKDLDGHRSMAGFCRANMNWSTTEAGRRMSTARAVDHIPGLGDAWYMGLIGAPQAHYLAKVHGNPRVRDDLERCAPTLLQHAEELPYSDFTATVDHFVSIADEDGAHDDRDHATEGRTATVVDVGGLLDIRAHGGNGILSDEIIDIFNHFVDLEYENDVEARRAEYDDNADTQPLPRTDRQRRFDALVNVFRHAQAALADGLDASSAEVTVDIIIGEARWAHLLLEAGLTTDIDLNGNTIDPFTGLPVDQAKTLLDRIMADPNNALLARCETANGKPVHPHDVLRAAIAGHIRRVVVDSRSVVIDMGRRQRLFTGSAKQAAQLLTRHCEHPGCELPTTWCETDHATEWNELGTTDQANARNRCGHHNREKHLRKWQTRITTTGRTITIRQDGTMILPVGTRPPRFPDDNDDPDHQ